MDAKKIDQVVDLLQNSKRSVAFTGSGVSIESGIPTFRGTNGIWHQYNPQVLEISYFYNHPYPSWVAIKEIFYDFFEKASPNPAHTSLAKMEEAGKIQTVITQNIDHLHQNAGSKSVIEYHGTSHRLICKTCGQVYQFNKQMLSELPPTCAHCKGILKPDFVFFGEPIPTIAQELAESETNLADVWIIVGTSGEVYPACYLPRMAKQNGKTIIEINTTPSLFTTEITDIFIEGEAGNILFEIANKMGLS